MDLQIDGLEAAVRSVRTAVSRDRKHPAALRCVLVDPEGDVVRVVATDKHRLAVAECAGTLPRRMLLDPDALVEAAGVADEFPAYERFLAADPGAVCASVDRDELLSALEAEADDGAPIAVAVVDGEVRLGSAVADPSLHVDAGYLHDALEAAGAGEVVIEASSPTAPVAVRSDTVVTILMPVRIAN